MMKNKEKKTAQLQSLKVKSYYKALKMFESHAAMPPNPPYSYPIVAL